VKAVAEHARREWSPERLVLGGKSMGGRIASQAVAKGLGADGLVFLGYPLHPPGRTDKMRDAHLTDVACPMLFLQGTRDAFAQLDLLRPVVELQGERGTLHLVEGGDHSFAVLKRDGRSAAEVDAELVAATASWLSARGL
jgi:predicted alpha/beta-hydrolase family hydrolase